MEGITTDMIKSILGISTILLFILFVLYNIFVRIRFLSLQTLYGKTISKFYLKKGIDFLPFLVFNGLLLGVFFLAFLLIDLYSQYAMVTFFILIAFLFFFIVYCIYRVFKMYRENFVTKYIMEDLFKTTFNAFLKYYKPNESNTLIENEQFSPLHEILHTTLQNNNSSFIVLFLQLWKEFVINWALLAYPQGRSLSFELLSEVEFLCKKYNNNACLEPILDFYCVSIDHCIANNIDGFQYILPKYIGFVATSIDSFHWRTLEEHFLMIANKFLRSRFFPRFVQELSALDYYRKDFTDTNYIQLLIGLFWDVYRYCIKIKPYKKAPPIWRTLIRRVPSFDELFIENGIGNILQKTLSNKGNLYIDLVDIYFERIQWDLQKSQRAFGYKRCCNYYSLVHFIMDISGQYYTCQHKVNHVREQIIQFFDQYVQYVQNDTQRCVGFINNKKIDKYAEIYFFQEELKMWKHTLRQKTLFV